MFLIMVLAPFDQIRDLLICPCTRNPLEHEGDGFRVASNTNLSEIRYRCVRGQPVLVDFNNSVLDEKNVFDGIGASFLPRKQSGLKRQIKAYLLHPGGNRVAKRISADFVQMVKKTEKRPKILIIGGGGKGIGTDIFYDDPDIDAIGFDIYASPLTHFIADAHSIPLESESVDGVWIQYVLEHVLEPWTVVKEIARILKDDRLVYSETPFLQQVHEGAYDFMRFTHSGHRWLFRNFVEIESGVSMGPGIQFLWTIEHLCRGMFRSKALGKICKLLLCWFQFVEKLIPKAYSIDNASSFYFFGRKTGYVLKPKDIIGYYKGAL